ncbi:MAG TPA: VOC family protein [Pseudonocardiaceae bacterium]|nr:VOC family protein [Pseudonocardiaceae bacterium]
MTENTQNVPAPTVWPAMIYADAPAAIRFLVEAFGFVEALVVPGEQGREIVHAELRWPEGGGVMLGSRDENSEFGKITQTSNYVVTDHPDELFKRATDAGASVVRELRDEDYGSRGFTVRDPEGNLWSFGTYRGA